MTDHVLERVEAGVATLTLNRPEARNAMSPEMMGALREAVPRLAADRTVRAVVLTGEGGAFCAGGDVKRFAQQATSAALSTGSPDVIDVEDRVHTLRAAMELSRWLHEMPKPTLAVIPGPAAGAGFSLALACDLRIASETAKLTTAFARIGLSGDYGGSYFLSKLVGGAKARELFFTADVITGRAAFELGSVNKVSPIESLETDAREYAARLAGLPTAAIGYMKKNLNAAEQASLSEVMDREALHMVRTFMTEDHKAAAKAFVEKRAPEFHGR